MEFHQTLWVLFLYRRKTELFYPEWHAPFKKKVLSEQKRLIGAEKTFSVCYDGYWKRQRALSKTLWVSIT